MIKNIWKKTAKILGISIIASMLFAACNYGISIEDNGKLTPSENSTFVKIGINSLGAQNNIARTALPEHELNDYLYTLTYKSEDNPQAIVYGEKLALSQLNEARIELRSRKNYDFNIKAYSGETVVLEGNKAVENLSGETYEISVFLNPVTGLNGNAEVEVDFPDDGVVLSAKYIYSTDKAAVPTENVVFGAGSVGNKSFIIQKNNIPSGIQQYFIFELYDSQNAVVYRRSESLYVVGNKTSRSTITIDSNYYYRKNLSVTLKKDGVALTDSLYTVKAVSGIKEYTLQKDSSGVYTGDVPAGTYEIILNNHETKIQVEAGNSGTVNLTTVVVPASKVVVNADSGVIAKDNDGNLIVVNNSSFTVKVDLQTGYEVKAGANAKIGGVAFTPDSNGSGTVTLNQRDIGSTAITVEGVTPIEYSIGYYDGPISVSFGQGVEVHRNYTIESNFALPVLAKTETHNFIGWNTETEVITEIKPGRTGNLTLTADWAEIGSVSYKINYLFEKTTSTDYEENATIKASSTGSGRIGAKTTITAGDAKAPLIEGFNTPVVTNINSIPEDGSGVVTVKYSRKTTSIKFNAGAGGSIESSPSKTISGKYGAPVSSSQIPVPVKTDYKLTGWEPALPETFVFPAENAEYTAVWEKEYAGYTIKYLYQNIADNNYTEKEAERDTTKKAVIGTTVTATAAPVTGFTAKTVESVTVLEDGSTVVNVYYDRKIININLDLDGGAIPGNDQIKWSGKYEASVSLPTTAAEKSGWEFLGWVKNGETSTSALPTKYPSSDVTYKAKWKQTLADFTVKVFEQKVDGTYSSVQANSFVIQGEIGKTTEVTQALVVSKYPFAAGFEFDHVENVTLETTGTVVNVYYKRKIINYTFNANRGGWGSETTKTVQVRYGAAVTKPANPTFGTLIFAGWGETSTADTITTVDETAGLQNKSYYAVWKSSINTGDASEPIDPSKLTVDFTTDTSGTTITAQFTYVTGTDPRDWNLVWQVNDRVLTGQTTNNMSFTQGTTGIKYEIKLIAYYKNMPYIKTHTVELK